MNTGSKSQPSFNESGWLIISVEHSGSRDAAYTNTFTAIPAHLPYRPKRLPHPKVAGSLNAHVVSPDNYTYAYIDDMGRYRVRLPFDLDEWSPGGDSRPVRLAKPYAGPSYGQHFPLHEGTEVMLSFVQGNPDRPYISGVMHDSKNQEHVNNEWNTRNVIRTWANNKLRMEDKQGQEHIKLATDYQKSQLNLGHIVNQTREKRGDNGEGFELRTDGWGSIRSNKGLLLTSYGQQGAQGHVLNMDETIAQLEQALALAKNLNKAAKIAQNAETSVKSQQNQLSGSLKDLRQSAIIQTAPNGIASATEQSQLHTAQENIHLISGEETDISAGSNVTVHAAQSLNLFAQTEGAKLQANQGKVSIQAQNDEMQINALKDATITSSAGKVVIAAKDEILLTSGGAYIKIANGEVELGMPNIARIRCAGLAITGANNLNIPLTNLPGLQVFSNKLDLYDVFGKQLDKPLSYTVIGNKNRATQKGKLDRMGRTARIYSDKEEIIYIFVGNANLLIGKNKKIMEMASYEFEFLDDTGNPLANCYYQILSGTQELKFGLSDSMGIAKFDSELIKHKNIKVRFWKKGQPKDAAFESEQFDWIQGIITQPIQAPTVYGIPLLPTENINHEVQEYAQSFYIIREGDTWESIAQVCESDISLLKIENGFYPNENLLPEVGVKLFLPQGSRRPNITNINN
ncbi:type VI secretion system tip protein VgrG [Wielerella bovis]|uniref:DUF2345 domain-containing protein n=1 Tax=Wielerella bovis TaxID=2917790 RepID=UPI0020187CF0|nr:type VI secretion system Vgr family protein [Wielerella bovis]ULJ63705.1 type VI secretion system tip protein VgrG [Wielerella bovis]